MSQMTGGDNVTAGATKCRPHFSRLQRPVPSGATPLPVVTPRQGNEEPHGTARFWRVRQQHCTPMGSGDTCGGVRDVITVGEGGGGGGGG